MDWFAETAEAHSKEVLHMDARPAARRVDQAKVVEIPVAVEDRRSLTVLPSD